MQIKVGIDIIEVERIKKMIRNEYKQKIDGYFHDVIAHIGDSRVYRIRKDFIRKITRDDSYVQTLIEDGKITKEEAFNHPKKNMITKALGCTPEVEPEIYTKTFIKNDIILMTSDGLTNMVKEEEIKNIIKNDQENLAESLVQKANENGGYDNITVVIIM